MAQFKGGKYSENGVLSYNYLGGKGGKGKGSVSIKKRGDSWYFVDEQGKVKNELGNGGKLTPTHMQNLERDGIFKNAKVNPETGGSFKGTEPAPTTAGDNVGIDSSGNLSGGSASVQPSLTESNYELPEMSAPASQASTDFTPVAGVPKPNKAGAIAENAPPTLQSGWGGETARYNKKMIGSGYSENTPYIPDTVSLPDQTMTSSPQASYGVSEFQDKQGGGWEEYNPDAPNSHLAVYDNSNYTFPTGEGAGQMSLRSNPNRIAGDFESAGGVQKLNTQNTIENMKGPGGYSNFEVAASPYVDSSTKGLTIGKRGYEKGFGFGVDDDFYRTKDGTLMKDGGWFSGDTAATQADINAGIKNQASPGMTSADGWNAAGSVMKGVGGLASAYTGIKNYQLARDAHNTQKNQWQANYDQQLKAYQQNKDLANQDIQSRNRTLLARNKARTDTYKEL